VGSGPGQSGRAIAVGRTAEIYAWNEKRVMKLYREGSSRTYVARELRGSELAHRLGLPAPAVHRSQAADGVHEVDGRFGILYDWIEGPTMLHDLGERPWMLVTHSKALAALHAQIHCAAGTGLPSLRERIEWIIDSERDVVPDDLRSAARARLGNLPQGDRVCHGDFHPDNVLLGDGGPMIVDWGPASCGHPCADVAWTILLFRFGTPIGSPLAVRLLLAIFRKVCLRVYLRTYARLTGRSQREVARWLGLIAVVRLSDRIPEERRRLLRLARRTLGGSP
jgi:aminoglycoside phosphotransferase (APT) family kinase protein